MHYYALFYCILFITHYTLYIIQCVRAKKVRLCVRAKKVRFFVRAKKVRFFGTSLGGFLPYPVSDEIF